MIKFFPKTKLLIWGISEYKGGREPDVMTAITALEGLRSDIEQTSEDIQRQWRVGEISLVRIIMITLNE